MENRYLEVVKEKSFITAMTSLQVAEITGKEHRNITADIEDEMSKLGSEISLLIFQQSEYTNERGRKYKMYNLSRDGAMQLGARYDATTRYKMIQRINELETFVKQDSYTITDPVERAKRWIEEQEEKKALELKVEAKEQMKEGKSKLVINTKWTQKGRVKINEILNGLGIVANMDKELRR